MSAPRRTGAAELLRQARHPPVRERTFWIVQAMVVVLAILHLVVDVNSPPSSSDLFPAGLPVAMMLVPIGYAALRYGLSGSAATALWATVLWLPDVLLPGGRGQPVNDVVQLVVLDAVAVLVGLRIERERLERTRAEAAEQEWREAEARYRELFETNSSPILLVDGEGIIRATNPAAPTAIGRALVGRRIDDALHLPHDVLLDGSESRTVTLGDTPGPTRDYRVTVGRVGGGGRGGLYQVVLHDTTEERRERTEARAYAAALLRAQEEERRRIAQELHDDPLQTLIQLARRLEGLGATRDLTPTAPGLTEARAEVLAVVARLRDVLRGLRPPGLDQLGLVAAVRGMLAELEDETGMVTELQVTGTVRTLAPEVQLGVFRVIQEATRNVVRHAEACRVAVTLAFDDDALDVQIADDGKGFDPAASTGDDTGRFGVLGMRERAGLLGGTFALQSAPGRGTVVGARIPTGVGRPR